MARVFREGKGLSRRSTPKTPKRSHRIMKRKAPKTWSGESPSCKKTGGSVMRNLNHILGGWVQVIREATRKTREGGNRNLN